MGIDAAAEHNNAHGYIADFYDTPAFDSFDSSMYFMVYRSTRSRLLRGGLGLGGVGFHSGFNCRRVRRGEWFDAVAAQPVGVAHHRQ